MVNTYKNIRTAESSAHDNIPRSYSSEQVDNDRYDKDIVNVFLNLAVKHVSSTLAFLKGFTVSTDTRAELYLAVAAIGGLFCQVPGSYSVAEAMYHDSRRLLHNAVSVLNLTQLSSC